MSVAMKSRIRKLSIGGGIAIAMALASQPALSYQGEPQEAYLPNYAAKMITPIENGNATPKLVMVRTRFPIRVTIVDDPRYHDPSLDRLVREACRKWAEAMRNAPERKFTFKVDRRSNPQDADIVVQFGTARDFRGFVGFTAEYEGWAEVRLALEDAEGNSIGRHRLARIATHEMGHALGIWGHSVDGKDIMSLNPDTREISAADVNTLRLAYHPSNKNR